MSALRRGQCATPPEGFSLNDYDAQRDLDLAGWLLQFGIRRDLLTYLQAEEENATSAEAGLAEEILAWIHKDPILTKDRIINRFGRALGHVLFPSLAVLFDTQPRNHMGVHATTVEELHRFQLDIDHKVQKHTTDYFDDVLHHVPVDADSLTSSEEIDRCLLQYKETPSLFDHDDVRKPVPFLAGMAHPIYCSAQSLQRNFLFTVDLSLPDTLLLAHFQNALARLRNYLPSEATASTRLSSDLTTTWIDRQLLAYIDLWMLRLQRDKTTLSNSEIVELIWPADGKGVAQEKGWGVQEIRDTVAPLATEILADHSEIFWILEASTAATLASTSLDLPAPKDITSRLNKPVTRRQRGKNK